MTWKRWFKYGKARIDAAVRDIDKDLDRKEAELAAEQAGKPWLTSDRDTPSFDEVKARIEDRAAHAPGAPTAPAATPTTRTTSTTPTTPAASPDADADAATIAFELAKQNKAAEERLAAIRKSLDLPDPNAGDH
jgi:hypothetical protein